MLQVHATKLHALIPYLSLLIPRKHDLSLQCHAITVSRLMQPILILTFLAQKSVLGLNLFRPTHNL